MAYVMVIVMRAYGQNSYTFGTLMLSWWNCNVIYIVTVICNGRKQVIIVLNLLLLLVLHQHHQIIIVTRESYVSEGQMLEIKMTYCC